MAAEPADAALIDEIRLRSLQYEARLRGIETFAFFKHPDDRRDAVFTIRAGAGGTDAMDWALRLERMYLRWFHEAGFEAEIVDRLVGSEAGIHHTEIEVRGAFAYGYLRSEIGVHRICHISPFDSNAKKQTSFAAVDVIPVYPEIEINILDVDIETDVMKAGGPGGQGVNSSEGAVRVRHKPTGITVRCQSHRSQFQNKKIALEILATKVKKFEEGKRTPQGTRMDAAFGHQIRTYVLQPYTLVKDHRTEYQTGNVQKVLDGDLSELTQAFLRYDSKEKAITSSLGSKTQ